MTPYLFTLDDFSSNRPLSACVGEPPVVGHIRWLRYRLAGMLPPIRTAYDFEKCCEVWEELIEEEFVAQRELGRSPHAVFDLPLEEDDECDSSPSRVECPDNCGWAEHVYPSDTQAVTFSTKSDFLLGTSRPNPKVIARKNEGGKNTTIRLHQLISLMAWCDLSKAIDTLIQESNTAPEAWKRVDAEHRVGTLVAGATELTNRAERHHAASAAKQRPSAVPVVTENIGTFIRYPGYVIVTFPGSGEKKIRTHGNSGKEMLGYYYLYHLLQEPQGLPQRLLTYDVSYKQYYARHASAASKSTLSDYTEEAAIDEGMTVSGAGETSLYRASEAAVEKLLVQAFEAEEEGDSEKAKELRNRAILVDEKPRLEESRSMRTTWGNTPERAAARNVGKALDRAIKHAKAEFPKFGEHLEESIALSKGKDVIYNPINIIEWEVSLEGFEG